MPPKGKGKRKKPEETPTAQLSKKGRAADDSPKKTLPRNERESKVAALVRQALFATATGRPIKGELLIDTMGVGNKAHHVNLLTAANKKLEKVFGLEIVLLGTNDKGDNPTPLYLSDEEDDGATESARTGRGLTEKQSISKAAEFVVLNKLPKKLRDEMQCGGFDDAKWGVVMTVLSFIYIRNMEVAEPELQKFLGDLGLQWKRENLELKIDGAGLVGDMRTEGFLYRKHGEQDGDKKEYLYRWGPRAHAELREGDIIAFMADVYEQPASKWAHQIGRPIEGFADAEDESD